MCFFFMKDITGNFIFFSLEQHRLFQRNLIVEIHDENYSNGSLKTFTDYYKNKH